MSQDIDARLRRFFATAPQVRYIVPMVSFSHSRFTRTWHLWREAITGDVWLENGELVHPDAVNFDQELAGTPANLDQEFTFTVSTVDIEDQFRNELDRVPIDSAERIVCDYREYISDDLTYPNVVAHLQVESLSYERGAATIQAVSPRLNITRTGELYTPKEIPMLRAFL